MWSTRILLSLLMASSKTFLRTSDALRIAITGSSQGIGLEAAKSLLRDGHTVYHACRSLERARVAVDGAGGGIPLVCDLADLNSVRSFASEIQDPQGICPEGLDVLCLNAGVAPSTKVGPDVVPQRTKQGYEICIGTNHLGHFLLASLLQTSLASRNGLLLTTASSVHDPDQPGGAVGGKGGATLGDLSGLGVKDAGGGAATMVDGSLEYDGGKVYKDSKLANMLFCREAFQRWGSTADGTEANTDSGLRIRSFSPGFIPASGLFREPRKDNWIFANAFTIVAGLIGFAVPITVGGDRLAYMATADDNDVPNGSYYTADTGSRAVTLEDGFGPGIVSKEASDEGLARRLWEKSLLLVGSE